MASSIVPAAAAKRLTPESIRVAAKQSEGIHLVPLSLRRAIKKFLRDKEKSHMNRKVLSLSQSFNRIKETNLQLSASVSRELVEDPFRPIEHGGARWKIRSAYGDIGLKYKDEETVAYVASRMPAVYSACHRVLKEVRRRLPNFSPTSVLDFGAGPGSAIWAMREVWPKSLERVNLVEPSKDMQRAAQSLLRDLKGLPIIHSYDNIQALSLNLDKHEREHDLVISSYALGEIPSLSDRITIIRQLWDLTRDVLAQSVAVAEIWLWEVASWKAVGRLQSHSLTVTKIEFSHDDSFLLAVSRDRQFSIFAIEKSGDKVNHRLITKQKADKRIIWACSWNPFCHQFATGSRDKSVKIWAIDSSTSSVRQLTTLPIFKDSVTALSWLGRDRSSNTGILAVGMDDGLIELWNVSGGVNPSLPLNASAAMRFDPSQSHVSTVYRLAWRSDDMGDSKTMQLASVEEITVLGCLK